MIVKNRKQENSRKTALRMEAFSNVVSGHFFVFEGAVSLDKFA